MTNNNSIPDEHSPEGRSFPSRRRAHGSDPQTEVMPAPNSAQPVESAQPSDSTQPKSESEPRYGVRMSEVELAEFRSKQGLPPRGHSVEQSADKPVGKRVIQPAGEDKQGSKNPYAFKSVKVFSPNARSGSVAVGAPESVLPSRKRPLWMIIVSILILLAIPVGLMAYTFIQLFNSNPQGSQVGQMRQVQVGESFPVRDGQRAWAFVQGIDASQAASSESVCTLQVGGASGFQLSAEPSGYGLSGQALLIFPQVSGDTASLHCPQVSPSAIVVGTGDFNEWSFYFSRIMMVAFLVGAVATVTLIVGIVWLVRVNRRRRVLRAEGVSS